MHACMHVCCTCMCNTKRLWFGRKHRVVAIRRCPPSDRALDALAAVKQQDFLSQPLVSPILPAFLGQWRKRPAVLLSKLLGRLVHRRRPAVRRPQQTGREVVTANCGHGVTVGAHEVVQLQLVLTLRDRSKDAMEPPLRGGFVVIVELDATRIWNRLKDSVRCHGGDERGGAVVLSADPATRACQLSASEGERQFRRTPGAACPAPRAALQFDPPTVLHVSRQVSRCRGALR